MITVWTSLDHTTLFHALWVQNEMYNRKSMLRLMIVLAAVELLVTLPMHWISPAADWGIRLAICAGVLLLYSIAVRPMRIKTLSDAAERLRQAGGGKPRLEYRFGEKEFSASGLDEKSQTPYSEITALRETDRALLLMIDRTLLHAIRKEDLSERERTALTALLSEKTGLDWQKASVPGRD